MLAICIAISASAQQTKSISGLIIDEKSEPVIGASIVVPGTTLGTVTNIDGKFSIKGIPSGIKSVQISYIGYQTQKIDITSSTADLMIKLVPANAELEEVVVVGYGVQKKAHMTGAITSINTKEVADLNTSNMATALKVRLTGLVFQVVKVVRELPQL